MRIDENGMIFLTGVEDLSLFLLVASMFIGYAIPTFLTISRTVSVTMPLNKGLKQAVKRELLRMMVDGNAAAGVTFDKLPYQLDEHTKEMLISAAYANFISTDYAKYIQNLSHANRPILLSGPSEHYVQMLAESLAGFFNAKVFLLDIDDFYRKIWIKHGIRSSDSPCFRTISEEIHGPISCLLGSSSTLSSSGGNNIFVSCVGDAWNNICSVRTVQDCFPDSFRCHNRRLFLHESLLMETLHEVLVEASKSMPVVFHISNVENLLSKSPKMYSLLERMLNKLSGNVLILGSRTSEGNIEGIDQRLTRLFPYKMKIRPPQDDKGLALWASEKENNRKLIETQASRSLLMEILEENNLHCNDLSSIATETRVLTEHIEEIVVSAVSHHLANAEKYQYRDGKLIIFSNSLNHALKIFSRKQARGTSDGIDVKFIKAQQRVGLSCVSCLSSYWP